MQRIITSIFISLLTLIPVLSIEDTTGFDVKHYGLNLNVSDTSTFIEGNVSITGDFIHFSDTIYLDAGYNLKIDSVLINNEFIFFNHRSNLLSFPTPSFLNIGDLFIIKVYYSGYAPTDEDNVTIKDGVVHQFDQRFNQHVTFVSSEPFATKYWFPCKMILTDKADSMSCNLITDPELMAVSNGLLQSDQIINGKRHLYWKSNYPIVYYLLFFAVSDYQEYSYYIPVNENDSIFFQNFIYDNDTILDFYKENIDATVDIMHLFIQLFGDFPFKDEKYGHCLVDGSGVFGGMEYQTMSVMHNFDFNLVAHELAHSWFGDMVTCKTWQDIWINEGFATYLSLIAHEFFDTNNNVNNLYRNYHRFIMQSSNGGIYLNEQEAKNSGKIFNYRNTYIRGAMVIHALRYWVNDDDLLFQLLKGFLQTYKFSNATIKDFQVYLENNSHLEPDTFFNQWLYGKGHPTYFASWTKKQDELTILLNRDLSFDDAPDFDLDLQLLIRAKEKDSIIHIETSGNKDSVNIYYPYNVEKIIIDPNEWLIVNNGPSDLQIDTAGIDYPPTVDQVIGKIKLTDFESPNYYYYNTRIISDNYPEECISLSDPQDEIIYHCGFDTLLKEPLIITIQANDLNGGVIQNEFIIDLSGEKNYVPVKDEKFKFFPNPVNDKLHFATSLETLNDVTLKITNLAGKIFISKKYNYISPGRAYPINVSGLSNGVYLLNLEYGNEKTAFKFVR